MKPNTKPNQMKTMQEVRKAQRVIILCIAALVVILIVAAVILIQTLNYRAIPDYLRSFPNNVPRRYDSAVASYDYSEGLTERGFWKGLTAVDHVTGLDFMGVEIPYDDYNISDQELEYALYSMRQTLSEEGTPPSVKYRNESPDAVIKSGDLVNIDYVGSVDGVEFSGGNSRAGDNENGSLVNAGSEQFIDDFLTQIIGASPGDTLDVNVTFPDPYQDPELAGKEALFVVDINYIVDADKVREGLTREKSQAYINENVIATTDVIVPDWLIDQIQDKMITMFRYFATEQEQTFSEYLPSLLEASEVKSKYSGIRGLIDSYRQSNLDTARKYITFQAIAETLDLTLSDEETEEYAAERFPDADFSSLADTYGMPELKRMIMSYYILDHISEHAVFLPRATGTEQGGTP